jgi:Zn-dependent protease with chaperone function
MIPIVKGFGRIAAILLGRRIRTWWRELPQAKKDAYSKKLRGMKGTFYAVGGVMGVCGLSYYVSHLEKTPITGRRRFIMFKEADLQESIKEEKDAYMEAFSDSLVPRESNTYQYVKEIVQRLLSTRVTEKMESTHWKLYVVDKDIINAFVLPSGEIFMFTGMLKALKDKDEVAIILGHEIAHCLLHHGLEAVSHQGVLEIFSLGFITAIWAVVQSDILSYVVHKMQDGLMSMLFKYPHSRKVELEADEVGLMIAAKACFDPKAGPRIWDRFQQFSEDEIPEYLSTHPGHGRRSAYLTALLPNAYAISYSSNCAFLEGEAQQFRKKFRLL